MSTPPPRPEPRLLRGMRDVFSDTVAARRDMIARIVAVYERFGFDALETPALEYVDVLGKFLPESDTPSEGVFSLRDEDEQWTALRYDLTAPLSRVVAQYGTALPSPFRRYQAGPVWRMEKPGVGRYREFWQCDFDTVGAPTLAADAEACFVLAAAFDALGIPEEDFALHVNDRKVLNGVLEVAGLSGEGFDSPRRFTVLRALDKLDRVGLDGVADLLGAGRKDPSGDFTKGAHLAPEQVERILGFLEAGDPDRSTVCGRLRELVQDSQVGLEGVAELEEIDTLLTAGGLPPERVAFDPGMVRGLAYYTGPVFEAVLTFEVLGDDGRPRVFGSVAGGGRYDGLVERFTATRVPATGASIGVDRLLAALESRGATRPRPGPVVVTTMDRSLMPEYQRLVAELRDAGIAAELYLGGKGFSAQLKYADKRRAPAAVIVGGDELARGEVSIKDLRLGLRLSKQVADRERWTKERPAQLSVPRSELVATIREVLARSEQED